MAQLTAFTTQHTQHIGYCGAWGVLASALTPRCWVGAREKGILREAAFPEAHTHSTKRFLLQPREEPGKADGRNRQLPAPYVEGQTIALSLYVADALDKAAVEGGLRPPQLTVRPSTSSFLPNLRTALSCYSCS